MVFNIHKIPEDTTPAVSLAAFDTPSSAVPPPHRRERWSRVRGPGGAASSTTTTWTAPSATAPLSVPLSVPVPISYCIFCTLSPLSLCLRFSNAAVPSRRTCRGIQHVRSFGGTDSPPSALPGPILPRNTLLDLHWRTKARVGFGSAPFFPFSSLLTTGGSTILRVKAPPPTSRGGRGAPTRTPSATGTGRAATAISTPATATPARDSPDTKTRVHVPPSGGGGSQQPFSPHQSSPAALAMMRLFR